METKQINNLVRILGKFKDLKRTGWLKREVITPESDAEHSFSLALLVLLTVPEELDKLRCLELALIHDLAEVYVGDFTPLDAITPQQKHEKELDAVYRISRELQWSELPRLFNEYEAKESREAVFVNALDKLDNIITARYFDDNHRSPQKLLPEFANHAKRCLDALEGQQVDLVKNILNELIS